MLFPTLWPLGAFAPLPGVYKALLLVSQPQVSLLVCPCCRLLSPPVSGPSLQEPLSLHAHRVQGWIL